MNTTKQERMVHNRYGAGITVHKPEYLRLSDEVVIFRPDTPLPPALLDGKLRNCTEIIVEKTSLRPE